MELRLTGEMREIERYLFKLENDSSLDIISISEPYKNRGLSREYRVYVKLKEVIDFGEEF